MNGSGQHCFMLQRTPACFAVLRAQHEVYAGSTPGCLAPRLATGKPTGRRAMNPRVGTPMPRGRDHPDPSGTGRSVQNSRALGVTSRVSGASRRRLQRALAGIVSRLIEEANEPVGRFQGQTIGSAGCRLLVWLAGRPWDTPTPPPWQRSLLHLMIDTWMLETSLHV